jgi:hypothetical protein
VKIVIGVLVGALVLGLLWCTLAYFAIPTWRVFLGWQSFWGTMAFLMLGLPAAASIHLPTGVSVRGLAFRLNVLGFFGPIAVAVYAHGRIAPSFSGMHLLPALVGLVAYGIGAGVNERGVVLPSWLLSVMAIGNVVYFHSALGLPLREVMWWSWVIQYGTILVPDLFLALTKVPDTASEAPYASVGGAGANDALWIGPMSGVSYAFLAQWFFWGGHDPSVFTR